MGKTFGVGVSLAILVVLSAQRAEAFRGGGGGHGGGGRSIGGERSFGARSTGDRQAAPERNNLRDRERPAAAERKPLNTRPNYDYRAASKIPSNYAAHREPFSPAWYASHPNAWRFGNTYPLAWGAAGWAATAAWLGWTATGDDAGVVNVLTGDTSDDSQVTDTLDNDADDSDDTTANASDNAAEEIRRAQRAQAIRLAQRGGQDPAADTEFMPLGVYSLAGPGQGEASAMLQLGLTHDGILRGNYYDLLSENSQPIRGAVDKQTHRVAWTIGNSGKVTFCTALENLTADSGTVTVYFENGETRRWALARHVADSADAADNSDATSLPAPSGNR